MSAYIKAICIASNAASPMFRLTTARLEKNRGLVGDRYHSRSGTFSNKCHRPDYNLTLIEDENIRDLQSRGISVEAEDFRRNIVTRGIRLNTLVGRAFMIGNIACIGMRLCEPCRHLEQVTQVDGLVQAMVHKGGLRARILDDGQIYTGDAITVSDQSVPAMPDAAEYQHS